MGEEFKNSRIRESKNTEGHYSVVKELGSVLATCAKTRFRLNCSGGCQDFGETMRWGQIGKTLIVHWLGVKIKNYQCL
jgi:hypothetical protein